MRRWPILVALLTPFLAAQQGVQLAWQPSPTPNTTVSVYRAATCSGPFLKVGVNVPAGGPFTTVVPATPGSSTAWQVTAVLGNQESAPSNCVVFTIPSLPGPPSAPTGLTVVPVS